MNLMHRLQLQNYLFWAVVLGFLLLAGFMVMPFAASIISAYILAYFIRPLFVRIKPRFGNSLAALLCILITILVVIVPICLISFEILSQMGKVTSDQGISNIVDAFAAQPLLKSLNFNAYELKAAIVQIVDSVINAAIRSIPSFVIGLVITLNGMFYLLCKWDNLSSHLKKYLPFKNNETMIKELGATADAIIHGHVLIAVLEAVIAFIGFSLFGVQACLIFSVLIFVLAFVPSIGPFLIWGPLALYYFSIGQYTIMAGVILTGIILMIGVEFYFYTRFVGGKSHIHPFIMLVGLLGGISVFGIFGFIIGPLLLATSIKIVEGAIVSHDVRIIEH